MRSISHASRGYFYFPFKTMLRAGGLIVASLTLLPSCGKDDEDKAAASTTFASLYDGFLTRNTCGSSDCHRPGTSVYVESGVALDLSSKATAFSGLTTKKSTAKGATATCADIPYVTAKDPSLSYLAAVFLAAIRKPGFGGKPACEPLNHVDGGTIADTNPNAQELAALKAWIEGGAVE